MTDDRSFSGAPDSRPPGLPDQSAIVRTMAAGVAHEFNNLFGAILASAEEALESPDPDESRRALRLIIDRVDSACVVTANLLSFACQDYIETRLISLDQLLDDALEVMAPSFASAGVSVVRDFRELPPVEIDPSRMERVCLNLLANAVEAMADTGGRVTVEIYPDRDWAVVRVSDTGHGIRADILPHVFEPFVTTKGVLAGGDTSALGLGLSVCQGIVRMHGGSITIASPPGAGVVATVFLPLRRPSANGGPR